MNNVQAKSDLSVHGLEVLDCAIEAFRRETRLKVNKTRLELRVADRLIDATVQIEGPNRTIECFVEIKFVVATASLANLARQFAGAPSKWILVTNHVSTDLARKMRELDIQFMDAVGNAYINDKSLLVFVHGNKPVESLKKYKTDQPWGRATIKAVFALLSNKDLVDAPYREIAAKAYIALGTLTGIFNDLTRQGYILETGAVGRRLKRKKELFDKWTEAFAATLRPRTLIGLFANDIDGFWQQADLIPYHAVWGGEVAASKMMHNHDPQMVTIYSHTPPKDLLREFKFVYSEGGNIELREQFWRFETAGQEKAIVPPILVYADLLATAVSKNIETAQIIYEAHIERHLRED